LVTQEQTVLPIPDNFQFTWDSPEEAAQFWTVDLMHWPNGISPLSATMFVPPFIRGFNKAAQELFMPMRRVDFKIFNNYVYMSTTPWSTDEKEFQQRIQQMQGEMAKHGQGLLERWYKEYEPEVRAINDETLTRDYAAMSDGEISGWLEGLVDKEERLGHLHFLSVLPAMGGVAFFEQVYTNLFGPPQGEEHLQLLQGFRNKTVEAGDGLWHLSTEARTRPQVMKVLSESPPSKVHDALPAVEGGSAFRDAVDEYTRNYGWRAAELDVAEVTWREDPAPVYTLVREYATRDDYDPQAEFKSLVAAREARERVLVEKIAGGPVELFKQSLTFAQQYLPIQEDHNFWIDQQGLCVQRMPILEAGRRLVSAGRINAVDDVFLLNYDEVQDAIRGGSGDLRELVEQRRAERERFNDIKPPDALGTTPPPEVLAQENESMTKFFGAPPPENPDPRVINGNGASAGNKTGTARVILALHDAGRLKAGEILVCPATMPPWTPLFGLASAVVTDHGGVLSHTAIVAREYQIPAVVGTKLGTSLIQDGQTITVEGTAGTVTLES
jgi:phosphohistidine swiveling domain-containing protein